MVGTTRFITQRFTGSGINSFNVNISVPHLVNRITLKSIGAEDADVLNSHGRIITSNLVGGRMAYLIAMDVQKSVHNSIFQFQTPISVSGDYQFVIYEFFQGNLEMPATTYDMDVVMELYFELV